MALLFPSKEMLLVLIFSISFIHFGSSDSIYDYVYDIEIYNGSPHTSLVTTCETTVMPLGTITIKPRSPQIFQCPWLVGEYNKLTCDLSLGKLHGGFTFFDHDRDFKRCKGLSCSWMVNERGVYMKKDGRVVFHYRWP
ncbi:hypothetical protein AAHA92_03484 [Salvia divinorum]|uniref:S-protein homolog n=1 Tax=Salvia divinorum TaxID=28513 RepID=A0ABD1IHU6_SALDI